MAKSDSMRVMEMAFRALATHALSDAWKVEINIERANDRFGDRVRVSLTEPAYAIQSGMMIDVASTMRAHLPEMIVAEHIKELIKVLHDPAWLRMAFNAETERWQEYQRTHTKPERDDLLHEQIASRLRKAPRKWGEW